MPKNCKPLRAMKIVRSRAKAHVGVKPIPDGEGFEIPLNHKMDLGCCDCGLVHEIAFAIEASGKLGVAMRRNVTATKTKRKQRRIKIEDGD